MKTTSLSIFPVAFLVAFIVLLQGCKTTRPPTPGDGPSSSIQPLASIDTPKPTIEISPVPVIDTGHDRAQTELPLEVEELNEQLYRDGLLGEVFFDFDRADLTPEARSRLERNARYLLRNAAVTINIEGHCDERGTNEYNLALSHRRAATSRELLAALGVSPERLTVVSFGEEKGVCYISDESCWSRNRRAYFRVTGQ